MATEREGSIRGELAAIILLSAGGFLLHLQNHPVSIHGASADRANLIPFILGLAGMTAVPFLLSRERTWLTGYLINGLSVVAGTVLMGYLMISSWHGLPGPGTVILDGMLSSIVLLFPKLIIGQKIFYHYRPQGAGRMFTPFWWTRHFVYVSLVFAAGKIIGG
jgi:hypothetical protein